MICQFVVEGVAHSWVNADGKSVVLAFKSGEDEVRAVVPLPDLEHFIRLLEQTKATLKAAIAAPSEAVVVRVPVTFAVGNDEDRPGCVMLTFDRSTAPSAYLLDAKVARAIGHRLLESARAADRDLTIAIARAAQPDQDGQRLQ